MLESSRVRSSVNQMEQQKSISQFYCCFHSEDVIAMMTRDMIEEPYVKTPLNILVLKGA